MEEGWGEEGPPLSSVLLRRGERKKEKRATKTVAARDDFDRY
jgi:hypothetical protein